MDFEAHNRAVAPLGTGSASRGWEFVASKSPTMLSLESVITDIAATTIPVLLVGESGTGKEMFARRIHALSSRCDGPLTKIACASMNAETLSAELGFSGNGHDTRVASSAGTVFFDEISELDAACQRVLLYALPDGDLNAQPALLNARVISTTNRNLDDAMQAGHFRSELYYRLNGVCLRLPPLRERKEDIWPLGEFFLTKHAAQLGRPRPSLSPQTLRIFLDHTWPGNIRELENAIKNIVVLGDEQLALSQVVSVPTPPPRRTFTAAQTTSLKVASRAASREAERDLILKALARTRWNRKRAAQELQISYKSLLYKLKQIGLPDTESTQN
jgi:two-component system, NtrC family, response regulator AtoC